MRKIFNKLFELLFNRSNRFLTIALIIIFTFFSELFIYLAVVSHQREVEKSIQNNSALAMAVVESVNGRIRIAEHALDHTIYFFNNSNLSFSDSNRLLISKKLSEIKVNFSNLEMIAIMKENGDLHAISRWNDEDKFKSRKEININDRIYFQTHKQNQNSGLVISDPQISKTLGTFQITLSKRIPSKHNEFKGIVSVTLNIEQFTDSFSKISSDPNLSITLLNNNRKIVARFPYLESQIGNFVQVAPEEDSYLLKNINLGSFIVNSNIDGVKRAISFHRLEKYPFTVYVGRTYENIVNDWFKYFYYVLTLLFILVSLAIFFLFKYFQEHIKLEKQKVETINAARMSSLGILAASVAHEINNPLTIIKGRATQGQKLLSSDQPLNKERLLELFNKIHETTNRMTKIISGIKVISRDGELDSFEAVSLDKILNHVIDYSSERFKASGIEIKISPIPNIKLNCRESQLTQVIINLLNNSYDAIEDFEIKWIHSEFMLTEKLIQIRVIDSGKGLSSIQINKIMNAFYTSKELNKGTGLGLYISKNIIENHQGRLFVDQNCQNTCFTIELPIIIQAS